MFYLQKRSIGLCVVLTIVTCGIYGWYWLYKLAEDVNSVKQEPGAASPGLVLVLSIVTCGIYTIYWFYRAGEAVDNAYYMAGMPGGNKAILYMLLALFGLSIVSYCLLQNDMNNLADMGPGGDRFGGYGGQGGYGNPYGGYGNPGAYNENGYQNGYGGQNGWQAPGTGSGPDVFNAAPQQNPYAAPQQDPYAAPQQDPFAASQQDPYAAQNSYITPPDSPFVPFPDEEPTDGSMQDELN